VKKKSLNNDVVKRSLTVADSYNITTALCHKSIQREYHSVDGIGLVCIATGFGVFNIFMSYVPSIKSSETVLKNSLPFLISLCSKTDGIETIVGTTIDLGDRCVLNASYALKSDKL
jgi:hypothetical protein